MFDLQARDTIVALATPRGRSAIAVVRISGPLAFTLRDQVFRRRRSGAWPAFVAVRGDVFTVGDAGDAVVIDDALAVSFPGPRSYCGEDMVEFSLHGSPLIVDTLVSRLLALGARPAEPGEFTLRAVLHGRLDLAAAEAVDAVVAARTGTALLAAQRALRGGLRAAIEPVRAACVDVLAELEARLDFPDDELGGADRHALHQRLLSASAALVRLEGSAHWGRRLAEGARVVLYGAPNAGKSTLLNALCGHDRALVHEDPGTTRDVVEAEVNIAGVACVVVDVAGVRDGVLHPVEARGIEKAKAEVERADVVVVLSPPDEPRFPPPIHSRLIEVDSKADLAGPHDSGRLQISAATGVGLPALMSAIARALAGAHLGDDEALVQTARQEQAVREARQATDDAIAAFAAGVPDEVVCSDVRRAARALDRLLGRDVSADVLELVFTRFCIGK